MGRNAVTGCCLFSQEWSWQILVVIFPLSYWHSSVMFSGAFLCCCFYSLTKTAISPLQCTFFFIIYSFAPFVLSRWTQPLQLSWKSNPVQHHQVRWWFQWFWCTNSSVTLFMSAWGVTFFTHCDTSGHLCPPHHPGSFPSSPTRVLKEQMWQHMENNICNFNCNMNFALPFLNCYPGQCFHQGRKAFQWEGGWSVPLKYCLQGT